MPSVQDATAVPRASREKKQSQSQSQSQKQRAPVKEEKTMEEALMEQHDEDEEDDEDDEERLEANDRKVSNRPVLFVPSLSLSLSLSVHFASFPPYRTLNVEPRLPPRAKHRPSHQTPSLIDALMG